MDDRAVMCPQCYLFAFLDGSCKVCGFETGRSSAVDADKVQLVKRVERLERVVKTARQFTREVLENVGYDFVVEAQNMMSILDEVLGVKRAPFSPSECAHKDLQLVRYDAGPQTEKESKPEWSVTIKICPDCGQFLVQTQIHEHHLDYVFSLKQPEHVEAAGKTVEYYKHLAREMRETHGH